MSRREEGLAMLRAGQTTAEVARELDVTRQCVEQWCQGAVCDRCAEPLRVPSDDGLCGFCQEEVALEVAA